MVVFTSASSFLAEVGFCATQNGTNRVMPQKLALLGGKPVRARPFPSWPVFSKVEEKGLLRVLRSGNWGRLDGREVAQFEKRFARMHGCKHGIAVVNGTVSLRIGLLAAGIRAEDEVIVPPYTFFSTASAVASGATLSASSCVKIASRSPKQSAPWRRPPGSRCPTSTVPGAPVETK